MYVIKAFQRADPMKLYKTWALLSTIFKFEISNTNN